MLLTYSLQPQTVAAVIRINKNIKARVCLPDGDNEFSEIVD